MLGARLRWERLELLIGRHAANVINGTGWRKKPIDIRQTISRDTYLRLRRLQAEAEELRGGPDDCYWASVDGQELASLLSEIADEG